MPRSGLRHVRQGLLPSKFRGTGLAGVKRPTPRPRQFCETSAFDRRPIEAEALVQDTRNDAAALRRAFAAPTVSADDRRRVRRRPPTGRGHARSVFQGPAGAQLRNKRARFTPGLHRALAWPRDPSFHDRSGPSLFAPPFTGGSEPTRRKETVQWPIKCLSTRRIRRKPGWSCCAATALRNSISRPRTANSFAATSISPR